MLLLNFLITVWSIEDFFSQLIPFSFEKKKDFEEKCVHTILSC